MYPFRDRKPKIFHPLEALESLSSYLCCVDLTLIRSGTVAPTNCENIAIVGNYWESTSRRFHWSDFCPNFIFWAIEFSRGEPIVSILNITTGTINSEFQSKLELKKKIRKSLLKIYLLRTSQEQHDALYRSSCMSAMTSHCRSFILNLSAALKRVSCPLCVSPIPPIA